jgi:hypothetical protein
MAPGTKTATDIDVINKEAYDYHSTCINPKYLTLDVQIMRALGSTKLTGAKATTACTRPQHPDLESGEFQGTK